MANRSGEGTQCQPEAAVPGGALRRPPKIGEPRVTRTLRAVDSVTFCPTLWRAPGLAIQAAERHRDLVTGLLVSPAWTAYLFDP